jgi:hypothetical protein
MSSVTFDTLQYAKKLKEAGFNEAQAEIQAEALRDIIEDNIATKRDLYDLEKNLTIKIGDLEKNLTIKIGDLEKNLIIKVGSIIIGSASVLGILITIFTILVH